MNILRASLQLTVVGTLLTLGQARAEAQACSTFTATNSAHTAAGRATATSSQNCSACTFGICGFPSGCTTTTTTYVAVGSGESLGTSGSLTTTLYQSGTSYRTTPPTTELSCTDKLDNDCDGKVDCADSQCASNSACATPPTQYTAVSGVAFVSSDPTEYNRGNLVPRARTWGGGAQLDLPDGALVTSIRCGLVPTVPVVTGTATIYGQTSDGQTTEVSEPLDLATQQVNTPQTFTRAISRLRRYTASGGARYIWIQLELGAVPPANQGGVGPCIVGYTL
jgi:hypothetical protein